MIQCVLIFVLCGLGGIAFKPPYRNVIPPTLPREIDLRELGLASLPHSIGQQNCGSSGAAVAGLMENLYLLQKYLIENKTNGQQLRNTDVFFSVDYILQLETKKKTDYCGGQIEQVLDAFVSQHHTPLEVSYPFTSFHDISPQPRPQLTYKPTEQDVIQIVKPQVVEIYHEPFFSLSSEPQLMNEACILTIKSYLARGISVISKLVLPGTQFDAFYDYNGQDLLKGRCIQNSNKNVSYNDKVLKQRRNIAVLIDGYGFRKGEEVWIIKLPFGLGWGAMGHAYVPMRGNHFCVETLALTLHPKLMELPPILQLDDQNMKLLDRQDLVSLFYVTKLVGTDLNISTNQSIFTDIEFNSKIFDTISPFRSSKSISSISFGNIVKSLSGFNIQGGLILGIDKTQFTVSFANFNCKLVLENLTSQDQQILQFFKCQVVDYHYSKERGTQSFGEYAIFLFSKQSIVRDVYELYNIQKQIQYLKQFQNDINFQVLKQSLDFSDFYAYGQVTVVETPFQILGFENFTSSDQTGFVMFYQGNSIVRIFCQLSLQNQASSLIEAECYNDNVGGQSINIFISGYQEDSSIFKDFTLILSKYTGKKYQIQCGTNNIQTGKLQNVKCNILQLPFIYPGKLASEFLISQTGIFDLQLNCTGLNGKMVNTQACATLITGKLLLNIEGNQYSATIQEHVVLLFKDDYLVGNLTNQVLFQKSSNVQLSEIVYLPCKQFNCNFAFDSSQAFQCNSTFCDNKSPLSYLNTSIPISEEQLNQSGLTSSFTVNCAIQTASCHKKSRYCTVSPFTCSGQVVLENKTTGLKSLQPFSFTSTKSSCILVLTNINSPFFVIRCNVSSDEQQFVSASLNEVLLRSVNGLDILQSSPRVQVQKAGKLFEIGSIIFLFVLLLLVCLGSYLVLRKQLQKQQIQTIIPKITNNGGQNSNHQQGTRTISMTDTIKLQRNKIQI